MPISAQLLNELFTCIQLVGRAYHRNDAASAIHHGQGKLLHILLTHDGCSQRELAAMMHIRPASLTELIQKAEAKGAIRRMPNSRDKRVSDVFLTEEGRRQAQDFSSEGAEVTEGIFAVFTEEEQSQLAALLAKLNGHLSTLAGAEADLRHHHHHEHRNGARRRSEDQTAEHDDLR